MEYKPCHLVAIADDHTLVRKGTVAFINSYPGFNVTIEAADGSELIEELKNTKELPDIVVLDISMPIMNGFDTAEEITKKWPQIKILAVTMMIDEYAILRMIR